MPFTTNTNIKVAINDSIKKKNKHKISKELEMCVKRISLTMDVIVVLFSFHSHKIKYKHHSNVLC